jgi:hypothetical protein
MILLKTSDFLDTALFKVNKQAYILTGNAKKKCATHQHRYLFCRSGDNQPNQYTTQPLCVTNAFLQVKSCITLSSLWTGHILS